MAELPEELLFGDVVVRHACDVSCPSDLGLGHDGHDAGDFRAPKNFSVRNFVLPTDVKEVSKASEMETIHLFFMASYKSGMNAQKFVHYDFHSRIFQDFPASRVCFGSLSTRRRRDCDWTTETMQSCRETQ